MPQLRHYQRRDNKVTRRRLQALQRRSEYLAGRLEPLFLEVLEDRFEHLVTASGSHESDLRYEQEYAGLKWAVRLARKQVGDKEKVPQSRAGHQRTRREVAEYAALQWLIPLLEEWVANDPHWVQLEGGKWRHLHYPFYDPQLDEWLVMEDAQTVRAATEDEIRQAKARFEDHFGAKQA